MRFKYIFFTLGFLCGISSAIAQQTGVGTLDPTRPLEVRTAGETVIVDESGKIGIGVADPITAIDLRNGANQAMALGMTDQTAAEAGAGAVRYNPSPALGVQGFMEFSDGTSWIPYYPYGKPRIIVMAEKNNHNIEVMDSPNSFVTPGNYTGGIPSFASSYLTHWDKLLDSDSGITTEDNFDAVTGEFVAPRAGVFLCTFTYVLADAPINPTGDAQLEALWEVRNSNNQVTQVIKTNNGFPVNTSSNARVGVACTVTLYLEEGDRLRPFAWMNMAPRTGNNNTQRYNNSRRELYLFPGYNVLSIIEQ